MDRLEVCFTFSAEPLVTLTFWTSAPFTDDKKNEYATFFATYQPRYLRFSQGSVKVQMALPLSQASLVVNELCSKPRFSICGDHCQKGLVQIPEQGNSIFSGTRYSFSTVASLRTTFISCTKDLPLLPTPGSWSIDPTGNQDLPQLEEPMIIKTLLQDLTSVERLDQQLKARGESVIRLLAAAFDEGDDAVKYLQEMKFYLGEEGLTISCPSTGFSAEILQNTVELYTKNMREFEQIEDFCEVVSQMFIEKATQ